MDLITTPRISAEGAQDIAGTYLTLHVGDLLGPGTPHLEHDRWVMPIELSNARRGFIGQVGTISVHAVTGGGVLFRGRAGRRLHTEE